MVPVEVSEPTIQMQIFDLTLNEESLAVNLDLVSEFRDKSKIREAACKIQASRPPLSNSEEGTPRITSRVLRKSYAHLSRKLQVTPGGREVTSRPPLNSQPR